MTDSATTKAKLEIQQSAQYNEGYYTNCVKCDKMTGKGDLTISSNNDLAGKMIHKKCYDELE